MAQKPVYRKVITEQGTEVFKPAEWADELQKQQDKDKEKKVAERTNPFERYGIKSIEEGDFHEKTQTVGRQTVTVYVEAGQKAPAPISSPDGAPAAKNTGQKPAGTADTKQVSASSKEAAPKTTTPGQQTDVDPATAGAKTGEGDPAGASTGDATATPTSI